MVASKMKASRSLLYLPTEISDRSFKDHCWKRRLSLIKFTTMGIDVAEIIVRQTDCTTPFLFLNQIILHIQHELAELKIIWDKISTPTSFHEQSTQADLAV